MNALELFPKTKEFWFDASELTIFNLNAMMENTRFFDRVEWPYLVVKREKIIEMKKKKTPNYQITFS